MTEPTLPALDAALHGRTRQAPSRWPAELVHVHAAADDDGLADLAAADPGADAPLRARLAALLAAVGGHGSSLIPGTRSHAEHP